MAVAERSTASRALMLLACVALAGCVAGRGDDDDSTGDGDADADADVCDERADDCARETICIGNTCEAAFGRRYPACAASSA